MKGNKTNITESFVKNCIVLEELDNHNPTDEEIRMYARGIGIDPEKEPDLLPIAREGVMAPVPKGWIVLQVNALIISCLKRNSLFVLCIEIRHICYIFIFTGQWW